MTTTLLNYFNQDELAASTWLKKYAASGEETPDDMHKRLALDFFRIDSKYQELEKDKTLFSSYGKIRTNLTYDYIYNLFENFKYIIPGGSIMAELGTGSSNSLSNCFVIGQPEDSYGSIMNKDEELVQLAKRRGGVGIDLSLLRPDGAKTHNAAKSSTGAVSFANRYSNSVNEVSQRGRRGALMISLSIAHPDSLEFINSKQDLTKLTGANISVKIPNDFMEAVLKEEEYLLRWPLDFNITSIETKELELNKLYDFYDNDNKIYYIKKIKAKELWNNLIKAAHNTGEPGIIFEDIHQDFSPDIIYKQHKGVTSNPCGEIFMPAYDACRLMNINYYSFVDNPFTKEASFDFTKFYEVTYEGIRLGDNLVDLEIEKVINIINKLIDSKENNSVELNLWINILAKMQSSRRIGLGLTGLGDMFAALNLKYDSNEAFKFLNTILYTKMFAELDAEIDLSILRGPFDDFDSYAEKNASNSFYKLLKIKYPEHYEAMLRVGRRNLSWSTAAPVGTGSLMTQTTSGIEPLFSPYYIRRRKIENNTEKEDYIDLLGIKWKEFLVIHPKLLEWAKINYPEIILDKFNIQNYYKLSPWFNSTANDINWEKRVSLQSLLQKYITHSISSTINLPENVSIEEVNNIYTKAWKNDLKGITIYRDGSRSGVLVLNSTKDNNTFEYKDAPKRPKELVGEAHISKAKGESFNIIVGLLNNKPYEVFVYPNGNMKGEGLIIKQGKGEYDFIQINESNSTHKILTDNMTDEQAAITRLTSTSLRHGADIKFVIEQLNKCDGDLFSFTKALARVLKKYIPEGTKSTIGCENCGSSNVIFENGCSKCNDCGYSKCN